MFLNDGYNLYLSTRSEAKTEEMLRRLASDTGLDLSRRVTCGVCDLSSLSSISSYMSSLRGLSLTAACLNAGLAPSIKDYGARRTEDGFERTVGVNHFGHLKMVQSGLVPMLEKGERGRIVVTASGVHDPDSPGGKQGSAAGLGALSGIELSGRGCEMIDGGKYDPDKAYKDSKLCNVFFTRELQARLNKEGSGVTANCFTPGLIVSTGLFREQNPLFTKVFDVAATNVFRVGETPLWGGGALHYMATDPVVGSKGGMYYGAKPGASKDGEGAYGTTFNVDNVSREVREGGEVQRRLWDISEKLVA